MDGDHSEFNNAQYPVDTVDILYFLICRFVEKYRKARPFPPSDDGWLGVRSPGFRPPSLDFGSPSLGLGCPSLGLGSPSPGLGSPSFGWASLGLGLVAWLERIGALASSSLQLGNRACLVAGLHGCSTTDQPLDMVCSVPSLHSVFRPMAADISLNPCQLETIVRAMMTEARARMR